MINKDQLLLSYGSLFSGAGGFELGLNKLSWQCKWMNEINKYPRMVLQNKFPGIPVYDNIYDVRGKELSPVDVIVAGFPCQSFSQAGLKTGSGINLFNELTLN